MNINDFRTEGCVNFILSIIEDAIRTRDVRFFESKLSRMYLDYIPENVLSKALNIDDRTMTSEEICAIIVNRISKMKKKQGWSTHAKKWKITSPEGVVFIVDNLQQFSKKHGLTASALSGVARGLNVQHKGWVAEVLEYGRTKR